MFQSALYQIKKNAVVLFLIKMTIFFSIVYLLDFTAGQVLRYFYFKQDSGLQYRTTYAVDKTRAELLIFGSSRANHHYVPAVLEQQFKMSYYNVGRDGNYVFYHFAVLQSVLKRYTPKLIILDVIHGEFDTGEESYDRLSSLLPYYKSHPEMRPIINLKSKYEKLKLISNVYPYNSSIFTIAIGNTDYNKKRTNDIKGYVPLYNKWAQPLSEEHTLPHPLDSTKINVYKAFLSECKAKGIKVYVVCSPYYINPAYTDLSISQASAIAQQMQVPFFDYSKDSFFLQRPDLFSDIDHLNDKGATIFSEKIAGDILAQRDSVVANQH